MTKAEAIEVLRANYPDACYEQLREAVNMAIEALETDVPDTNVGDTISRQRLQDAMYHEAFETDSDMQKWDSGCWIRYKMFENVVEALPSAQQWIPVTERLPEEEKRHYWVCTDTGYQCQCRWTNDVYGLGASDRWEWKIFDIPQYQKVVAWMPLPEAYKEDKR